MNNQEWQNDQALGDKLRSEKKLKDESNRKREKMFATFGKKSSMIIIELQLKYPRPIKKVNRTNETAVNDALDAMDELMRLTNKLTTPKKLTPTP